MQGQINFHGLHPRQTEINREMVVVQREDRSPGLQSRTVDSEIRGGRPKETIIKRILNGGKRRIYEIIPVVLARQHQ
jgi:hypothetical protein